MPSILTEYEHVDFIAARDFIWGDKTYKMGDDVPEAKTFGNLESMVRSRRLIPVVDNYDDAPFQFRRTVLTKELALTKMGLGKGSSVLEEPKEEKQDKPKSKPVRVFSNKKEGNHV